MPRSHRSSRGGSSRNGGSNSNSGGSGGGGHGRELVRYDSRHGRDRDRARAQGYGPDAVMKLPDPAHQKVSRRYSEDEDDRYHDRNRSHRGGGSSRGGEKYSRHHNHKTHEGFLALMGLLFCGMIGLAAAEHEGYCDGCSDWYHTCFGRYD